MKIVSHKTSKIVKTEEASGKATKSESATVATSGKGTETKEKSKKKKKSGDDSGLKRPLSAYMLFNNHRRPVLKEGN